MDTKLWIEESDNYTSRAIETYGDAIYNSDDKSIIERFNNINNFIKNPQKILDIGCSYGASINGLKDFYKDSKFFGIDPGKESIEIAKKNLEDKRIKFKIGHSHELPYDDNQFDIIIISMVLQWIPRNLLIRTISEVDRVLKKKGIIYIQEFLTNKPVTSQSRHDKEIYIFKDDYSNYFEAFPWFKEVFKEVKEIENGEDQQRTVSIIRKYCISEAYTLKTAAKETK